MVDQRTPQQRTAERTCAECEIPTGNVCQDEDGVRRCSLCSRWHYSNSAGLGRIAYTGDA